MRMLPDSSKINCDRLVAVDSSRNAEMRVDSTRNAGAMVLFVLLENIR